MGRGQGSNSPGTQPRSSEISVSHPEFAPYAYNKARLFSEDPPYIGLYTDVPGRNGKLVYYVKRKDQWLNDMGAYGSERGTSFDSMFGGQGNFGNMLAQAGGTNLDPDFQGALPLDDPALEAALEDVYQKLAA